MFLDSWLSSLFLFEKVFHLCAQHIRIGATGGHTRQAKEFNYGIPLSSRAFSGGEGGGEEEK